MKPYYRRWYSVIVWRVSFSLLSFNNTVHNSLKTRNASSQLWILQFAILLDEDLFVCLLLNGTSALFRLLVPRIVEIKEMNVLKNTSNNNLVYVAVYVYSCTLQQLISLCIHDSNKITTAIPIFSGSSNMTRLMQIPEVEMKNPISYSFVGYFTYTSGLWSPSLIYHPNIGQY